MTREVPRWATPGQQTTLDPRSSFHVLRLQGSRPEPRRGRPSPAPPGRARDARPDGAARGVRRLPAAQGRAHRRLAAHDRADRRAHRDPHRARRRGPLGLLQHLLHPGRGRRGRRRRPERHPRRPAGCAGLRLEGRDAAGVLVVHRADPHLARWRGPEHDPGRRRRRHPPGPQGQGVGEGRRRAVHVRGRLRGVRRHPRDGPQHPQDRPAEVDDHRGRHQGRHRGDHDRRPPAVPAGRGRRAALPGDQRQRLGHQVQVRQQVRLPAQPDRRPEPGHRRADRRQGRRHRRLRRRGQGLRRVAARPGRPGDHHRDRPDLRAAGGDGGLPGRPHGGRRRDGRHLRHHAPGASTSSPPTTCAG